MKRNRFSKYMQLMKNSKIYFIENDIEWYYIYNSYMLLRIPTALYKIWFNDYDSEHFPINEEYDKTIEYESKHWNKPFVRKYIEKLNIARSIPSRNTYYTTKTDFTINTGQYTCNAFVTIPDRETNIKPFVVTVNEKFIDAFEKIFEYDIDDCYIYGGANDHTPLLYMKKDILGFVLPVRYNKALQVKDAIASYYSE